MEPRSEPVRLKKEERKGSNPHKVSIDITGGEKKRKSEKVYLRKGPRGDRG